MFCLFVYFEKVMHEPQVELLIIGSSYICPMKNKSFNIFFCLGYVNIFIPQNNVMRHAMGNATGGDVCENDRSLTFIIQVL